MNSNKKLSCLGDSQQAPENEKLKACDLCR